MLLSLLFNENCLLARLGCLSGLKLDGKLTNPFKRYMENLWVEKKLGNLPANDNLTPIEIINSLIKII